MIEEQEKLVFFSKFKSELLEHQIKQKEDKIKELKGEAANTPFMKLPQIDKKLLYRHYRKKLKFYESMKSKMIPNGKTGLRNSTNPKARIK